MKMLFPTFNTIVITRCDGVNSFQKSLAQSSFSINVWCFLPTLFLLVNQRIPN